MLYSQHFTFHWKLLGLVSRIEKSGTGDNNWDISVRPTETRGAYHLTENFKSPGWKVNGKVTFRKFQPKTEEYVLR